jgi:hypothetical protein
MAAIGTVNDPTQINVSGTSEELVIPVAADRVMLSYEDKTVLDSRIQTMTAPAGAESVQFDMIGDASTIYREVGKSILNDSSVATNDTPSRATGGGGTFMEAINHGRRKVYLDRPLLGGPVFIDDFQGFISTLDRGGETPILGKLGYAIAKDSDILGMRTAIRAAAPATITGYLDWSASEIPTEFRPSTQGENWFVDANAKVDGSALLDQIRVLSEYWDDNNVPDEGRVMFLRPAQYNLLVQNQDLLNRDYGGANGIFSDGTVYRAWGIELVKTTLLPNTDVSADGTSQQRGTTYSVDCAHVAGLGVQSEALAKARSEGISLMTKDLGFEYGGTGMVAEATFGFDCLRPKGVGVIAVNATT